MIAAVTFSVTGGPHVLIWCITVNIMFFCKLLKEGAEVDFFWLTDSCYI